MEPKPFRTTVSILRTVLHLLKDDPALRPHAETTLEFRRAATKLIAEIEAEQGITQESLKSKLDEINLDTALKQ